MFIVSYKQYNEEKQCSKETESEVVEFVKESGAEIVIDKVYEVDYNGNVSVLEPYFEGQIILKPVGGLSNG